MKRIEDIEDKTTRARHRPAWLLPTPARTDEPPETAGGVRPLLLRLMRGEDLTSAEAANLLDALLDGTATDAQIAAALTALAVKGETIEELAGMARAMRARALRINSRHACFIDTAGTGSSRAKTFNVSTAAAFVIAGAGLPVAKHGSRAATSRSGSADVLAALGVNTTVAPEVSEACLNEHGICFMFAPLYHKATARVASVRRELGVHTTFNLLGPLTNPARAPRQIIGVWHRALVEPLARTLALLGTERAWVMHGADGLDEATLVGETFVAEACGGVRECGSGDVGESSVGGSVEREAIDNVRTFTITPQAFGLNIAASDELQALRGGDAEANAHIIRAMLTGERHDAARSIVVLNAAAALVVGGCAADFRSATRLAEKSIDDGAALTKLNALVEETNR